MKRTFFSFALLAAIAFGAASCSNPSENTPEEGSAQLTIMCDFAPPTGSPSRATVSTAIPGTDWIKNIKSLTLLLTDAAGTIKYVLPANVPNTSGIGAQTIATASTLIAGTYQVYLIANAQPTIVTSPHGTAAIDPSLDLDPLVLQGKNIGNLNFATKAVPTSSLPDGITSAYQEPTEIFWGSEPATVSTTSNTITVTLTRAVSLLRVRINKDSAVANGANADVDFTDAVASLAIRRTAGTQVEAKTGLVGGTSGETMFSQKPFSTTNAPADYTGNMGLAANVGDDDFSCWCDYLILPGGTTDMNTGFNVVVTGKAPANYAARNSNGAEEILTTGGPVFWIAAVEGVVPANGIMELNLTLESKGQTGDIPPPATLGELKVEAKLTEWGAIQSINIPI